MVAADFETAPQQATAQGDGANPNPSMQPAHPAYVLSPSQGPASDLVACLRNEGLRYQVVYEEDIAAGPAADAAVLIVDLSGVGQNAGEALLKQAGITQLPAIAAIGWSQLRTPDLRIDAADVIVVPWRPGELTFRVRRQMDQQTPADEPGVIRAGDLVINTNRYDVFLAGKPVLLTFKEYELLKLLAGNPGRVYSREALLEQVWGYQYFGGTRTVDVHVRRLRSKIEDASHTFIDTVWNVGYRFHA